MIAHYSTLTASEFNELFDSCKSYHEHMMKIAVQYADVKDDESMFEWLMSYFDKFILNAIPKSDRLEDWMDAAPNGTALNHIKELCRVIASNNSKLRSKYEELCKKYYGKSIQEEFEREKQSFRSSEKQNESEFKSVIDFAFTEVDKRKKANSQT